MKSNIETYLRLKPILPNEINHFYNNHQDSFLSNNNNEINNNEILLGNIEYEISSNGKVINIHVPEEMRKGYVNNMKKSYDFQFNDIFEQFNSRANF